MHMIEHNGKLEADKELESTGSTSNMYESMNHISHVSIHVVQYYLNIYK